MNRSVSIIVFLSLLVGMLFCTLNIQPATAWTGTAYITSTGDVSPPDAPIHREGNYYTLTGNIVSSSDGLIIQKSNIMVDGAGYTIQSTGSSSTAAGVKWVDLTNVTLKNTAITHITYGVYIEDSSNNTLLGNNVTGSSLENWGWGILLIANFGGNTRCNNFTGNRVTQERDGISLNGYRENTTVASNTVTECSRTGIDLEGGYLPHDTVMGNTLTGNSVGIRDTTEENHLTGNNVTKNSLDGVSLQTMFDELWENNVTENGRYGIYLEPGAQNNILSNNNASENGGSGICLKSETDHECKSNNVSANTASHNSECGIYLNDSRYNTISCNNLNGNTVDGICMNMSANFNEVINNSLTGNYNGIHLYESANNTLSSNNVTGNTGSGIYFEWSSDDNTIVENNIRKNGADGIHFCYFSQDNGIRENNITENGADGIYTFRCGFPYSYSGYEGICENNVSYNKGSGIHLCEGVYGRISWNNVSHNEGSGIHLLNYTCINDISWNSIRDNSADGILIDYPRLAAYSNIHDNTVANNLNGIHFNGSASWNIYSVFSNKVTENSAHGILCDNVSALDQNVLIYDNLVTANNGCGILLNCSSHQLIDLNNVTKNSYGIGLYGSSINGIQWNNVTDNDVEGIYLDDSQHNWIEGNDVERSGSCGFAIRDSSDYNNIVGNIVESYSVAVLLAYCSNNTFSGNNVTDSFYGIKLLDSSNNTIIENHIAGNPYGIVLDSSSSNTIYHNNLDNPQQVTSSDSTNSWNDVYPSGGNYWSDYHDTDIKIGPDQDQGGKSDGICDHAYPIYSSADRDNLPLMEPWPNRHLTSTVKSGENTYSVPVETNTSITCPLATTNILTFESSGPTGTAAYVNVTFPMGLNTTAIRVYVDHQQLYPPPFPIITSNGTYYFIYFEFTQSAHDLTMEYVIVDMAVANFTHSKTVVGQGYSVNITTTVQNQGDLEQTFNFDIEANQTVICSIVNDTLGSGGLMITMYPWNTSGLLMGNYTIMAHIDSASGELDIADNNSTRSWIVVTIPGDVNGDFTVDIYDAVKLAGAFGHSAGERLFNPNADINGDDTVDIYDAVLLAIHYGQQYV